jgi:glycosyltransferase involved in cell wall biosynthesis
MTVALVHDHLNQAGGAERVLEQLHRLFPDAPIYTAILDRDTLWPGLRDADFRVSWMQRLPGIMRHYRAYLPFYPLAIQGFDLRAYDLVISSSSSFAKAAVLRPDACHICYCHTPMRFVWDYNRYVEREEFGWISAGLLPLFIRMLKRWDMRTANRVQLFIANSTAVADRIARYYGRSSEIIFPPVGVERLTPADHIDDYYLIVSRLVPYKRLDLAVSACTALGRRLLVVGEGPGRHALERLAGPTVEFLGHRPDAEVADLYARCRGLLFPGVEDFGITPLEANAAGRPVIAYAGGGALDTVIDGETGVLFHEQTVAGLQDAMRRSETLSWRPDVLRRHAERFNEAAFLSRMSSVVERALRINRRATARTPVVAHPQLVEG